MLDDLNQRPTRDGQRETPSRTPSSSSPMVDREVPIVAATPFEAMHRWLDGEGSEAEAIADAESARYVALWRRVGEETTRRRAAAGPSADFTDRLMAALPGAPPETSRVERIVTASAVAAPAPTPVVAAAPAVHVAAPAASTWWQRPVEMNPTTALAAAAGLVALGLVLGGAIRGQ